MLILFGDFGAGAEITVGVVRIVPVHLDLAIVAIHVQHIAVGIARAHKYCIITSVSPTTQ